MGSDWIDHMLTICFYKPSTTQQTITSRMLGAGSVQGVKGDCYRCGHNYFQLLDKFQNRTESNILFKSNG